MATVTGTVICAELVPSLILMTKGKVPATAIDGSVIRKSITWPGPKLTPAPDMIPAGSPDVDIERPLVVARVTVTVSLTEVPSCGTVTEEAEGAMLKEAG